MSDEMLVGMLLIGPCSLRNFNRPECKPAYWCDECNSFAPDAACLRDALRDSLRTRAAGQDGA